MKNIAGYWFGLAVIGTAVCGCGSSNNTTGSAPSCGGTAACGGTVDGTWQLDQVCTEGDLASAVESAIGLPTECAGAVQSATMSATGTIAFANGTQTDDVTTTLQGTAVVTAACVGAALGSGSAVTLNETVCALVQTQLAGGTGVTSATCSFGSPNCNCSVVIKSSDTASKAYTIAGTSITYTNGDPPTDYCVAGTTLTARQRQNQGNIYIDSTLHKM